MEKLLLPDRKTLARLVTKIIKHVVMLDKPIARVEKLLLLGWKYWLLR